MAGQYISHLFYASLITGLVTLQTACNSDNSTSATPAGVTSTCMPVNCIVYNSSDISVSQYDLHLVKEDGTGTTILANSPDTEVYNGITTNGRVIFTRIDVATYDLNLYAVTLGGLNEIQLGASTDPEKFEFITDDNHILFSRDDAGETDLYIINADNTGLIQLTNTDLHDERFEAIAPDGRIIFIRSPLAGGNNDLYSIMPDGSNEQPLAITTNYEEYHGVSTGGRVVYRRDNNISDQDLYSVSTTGTGLQSLGLTTADELFDHITQDEKVIFNRGNYLYIVDIDGDNERRIHNTPNAGNESFASETPSGQFIFRRKPVSQTHYDIYIVDADGNNLTPLATTSLSESFNAITSTNRVIYSAIDLNVIDPYTDLHSININGTEPVNLTNSPALEEGFDAITPDGRIIFHRYIGGQSDLHIINADGTGELPLANSVTNEVYSGMTASGRVIFSREYEDLYSVNLDGTDERTLAATTNHEYFNAAIP